MDVRPEEGKDLVLALGDDVTFIKTTYDISLDSQISLLPLGFSLLLDVYSREVHILKVTMQGLEFTRD